MRVAKALRLTEKTTNTKQRAAWGLAANGDGYEVSCHDSRVDREERCQVDTHAEHFTMLVEYQGTMMDFTTNLQRSH